MQNDYYSVPHDLFEDILQHPESYLHYYEYRGRQCAKHQDAGEGSASLKIDKKVFENIRRQFRDVLSAKKLQGNFGGGSMGSYIAPHLRSTYMLKLDIVKCFNSVSYELFERSAAGKIQEVETIKNLYFRPNLLVGLTASSVIAEVVLIKVVDNYLNGLLNSSEFKDKGIVYTRFYDDIFLSSPEERVLVGLRDKLTERLNANGFQVSGKKSFLGKVENARLLNATINKGQVYVGKTFKNNLRAQIHHYHPDDSTLQSLDRTIRELSRLIGKISHILRTETKPSKKWRELQHQYVRELEEYQAIRDQIIFENLYL